MKSHTIVYLDQNYLSNLAKARYCLMKDENQAKFWRQFFEDLQNAVFSDSIRIPMSEFHEIETLDIDIQGAIKNTLAQLSIGFQFKDWHSILEWQIIDAVTQFSGMKLTSNYHPVFQSDPNTAVKDRFKDMIINRGTISLTSYWVADPNSIRELKVRFVNLIKQSLEKWPDIQNCSSSLVLASKLNWLSSSLISKPYFWYHIVQDITRLGIQESVINDYWITGKILDIPFIDVFSSLFAVLYLKYKKGGQNVKEGDLFDISALATVLPYCSIVTTDKSMKEIVVHDLKYNKKYKAEIFSCTKKDRIDLHNRIKQLLNTNQIPC